MWLAETAVDLETLDIMAEHGILFTILSPYQAHKVRKIAEKEWKDVSGGRIDPKMPYRCVLPSGRTMTIFFYDGPVSQDVAFSSLLDNGENFVNRLIGTFSAEQNDPQLVHIATDGETYGHHQHFGEMALSYGFHRIITNKRATITVYGEYLANFPPIYDVQIIENSSWSCFHGVERWRSDCGCNIGTNRSWNQSWRAALRQAMDWLRDRVGVVYEEQMSRYVNDPWRVRNAYIDVILNRTPETIAGFFTDYAAMEFSPADKTKMLKLLEMQRHAMLMYTSCGWFFDDISNIETVQVIQYAARVIQLAKETSGADLEADYLRILEKATSNIAEHRNGAHLFQIMVKPSILDLTRVGAHYAVASLFNDFAENQKMYCYTVDRVLHEKREAGKQQLVIGNVKIRSDITGEEGVKSYAILHLGDHIVFGGVADALGDDVFAAMQLSIQEAFRRSNVSEIISLLDRYFGGHNFSLWHLFRDEQRRVLKHILGTTLKEIETSFRQINEHHYPIMLAMKEIGIPMPDVFVGTFEFIFNTDIQRELENDDTDAQRLLDIVKEVKFWSLGIDKTTLGFIVSKKIGALMEALRNDPENVELMKQLETLFKTLQPLALQLRVWELQNIYFGLSRTLYPSMKERAHNNDKAAKKWIERFDALENYLSVKNK
jgi:hypothetical protein